MDNLNISEPGDNVKISNMNTEHNVFKNDPIYFKSLIGKKVEVLLFNESTHAGNVYCIDPVSESIVLLNKVGDRYDTDIILGYTVRELKILSDEKCEHIIFKSDAEVCSDVDIEERKAKVKNWLQKNLINVEDDKEALIVANDLTILPPYNVETCLSSNTIVLERIQDLLAKMPPDINADIL